MTQISPENNESSEHNQQKGAAEDVYGAFRIGDSTFAISLASLQEVIEEPPKIIQVPLAPDYMLGVFNLRGTVIPIIDTPRMFQLNADNEVGKRKVAILRISNQLVGCVFDCTSLIFRERDVEKSTLSRNASIQIVKSMFKVQGFDGLIQVLDEVAILSLQGLYFESSLAQANASYSQKKKTTKHKRLISFRSDNINYAFNMEEIVEIVGLEKFRASPSSESNSAGMLELRDQFIPVLALTEFLSGERKVPGENGKIVILRESGIKFGLLVDSLQEIIPFFEEEILVYPAVAQNSGRLFKGIYEYKDAEIVIVINYEELTRKSQISDLIEREKVTLNQKEQAQAQQKALGARKSFVTFSVEGSYALELLDIREIINEPKTYLNPPTRSQHVKGILNLRGEMITIFSARSLLEIPDSNVTGKILISQYKGVKVGVIVDDVHAILTTFEGRIQRVPEIFYSDDKAKSRIQRAIEIEDKDRNRTSLLILTFASFFESLSGLDDDTVAQEVA